MTRDWDESEHPRHPAGTAGGRGGEFRAVAGGWAQATLFQMGLGPEQDILQILRDGAEVGRTTLSGGNSAQTEIVDYKMPDGSIRRLVSKTSNAHDVAYETLASAIGREALDAPVPVVVPDPDPRWAEVGGPRRLWMPLVDGYSPMQRLLDDYRESGRLSGGWDPDPDDDEPVDVEEVDWEDFWDFAGDQEYEIVEDYAHGYDGATIGLLDLLLRNSDRHIGNWLIKPVDQTIVGIDHTHVDLFTHLDENAEVGPYWWDSPFTRALFIENDTTGDVERVNWHPADIQEAYRHLQALLARPSIVELMRRANADPEVILSRLRWVGAHANPDSPRRYE